MEAPAPPPPHRDEPRWPAALALLAAAGLALALPHAVTPGPRWLIPASVGALLAAAIAAHRAGRARLNAWLGLAALVVLTAGLLAALALLVAATVRHAERPLALLGSALALWSSNVLTFAAWYWRLDAGGPHRRDARSRDGQPFHAHGFLFPQLTLPLELRRAAGAAHWRPRFVDYLFLAFTASTALSPTDAPVLAGWAKALLMLQASVSLTAIAVLAGRAVNIL